MSRASYARRQALRARDPEVRQRRREYEHTTELARLREVAACEQRDTEARLRARLEHRQRWESAATTTPRSKRRDTAKGLP